MNRKEGIIMGTALLATFITGVFAVPEQQILNVFVTNFPEKSHLGQDLSSHVALRCQASEDIDELFCLEQLPDGTQASTDFEIPVGMVLVVTDVAWETATSTTPNVSPGDSCTFNIRLSNAASNLIILPIFHSSAIVAADGLVGASEHMTSGFVVSPEAQMWASYCSGGYASVVVWLYGYLKVVPPQRADR